jgi:Taurine catabolism dioxygenase TauD, TfdA family
MVVDISSVTLSQLPDGKSFSGHAFPLLVKPNDVVQNSQLGSLTDWIERNSNGIDDLLLKHGAILFRDFSVNSAQDFDAVVSSSKLHGMKYIGTATR